MRAFTGSKGYRTLLQPVYGFSRVHVATGSIYVASFSSFFPFSPSAAIFSFRPHHKLVLRVDRTSKSSIRSLRNWETRLLNAFHVSCPSPPVHFTRFSAWTSYRSKVPFVEQLFPNYPTSTYERNAITSGGENGRECTRRRRAQRITRLFVWSMFRYSVKFDTRPTYGAPRKWRIDDGWIFQASWE